jgi:hypothetical protein
MNVFTRQSRRLFTASSSSFFQRTNLNRVNGVQNRFNVARFASKPPTINADKSAAPVASQKDPIATNNKSGTVSGGARQGTGKLRRSSLRRRVQRAQQSDEPTTLSFDIDDLHQLDNQALLAQMRDNDPSGVLSRVMQLNGGNFLDVGGADVDVEHPVNSKNEVQKGRHLLRFGVRLYLIH